jgi:hypothetical protein
MVIFDVFSLPVILLAFPLNRPRLLAAADALRAGVLVVVALLLVPVVGPGGAVAAKIVAKGFGFLVIVFFLWGRGGGRLQRIEK